MLLLSFLLLIPRICISWAAEQGTDSRAKVFGYCFMELMKSANHKHKQLQCYCRTVWAPAFSFLLKCYYIYCQHRGNAMLSSLFHEYAFAPLAAVPLSRLSCRIPYSMGYESQQQKNWGTAAISVKLKGAGEGMSLFSISSTPWLLPVLVSGPAKALQVKAVLTSPGTWGVSGSLEMCKALVLGCAAGQGCCGEDPAWHKLGGGGRTVILFWRM